MRTKWFWISRIALPISVVALSLFVWLYGIDWWDRSRQRAFFASCIQAQRMRKWDELKLLAEKWCQWSPRSADPWIFRADAAQQLGDFASAADYLAKVPEDDPKALPALVALSKLQFGQANRPLDGVQTCESILRIEPRTAAAHQGLIEFYATTMQRQKLLHQIRFAIAMGCEPPSAYVYYFLVDSMRLANGIELNTVWQSAHPDAELFLVAEALHLPEPVAGNAELLQDKHARITALFQKFPNNVELLAYQMNFAIRTGDVPELVRLLKRVPAMSDGDDRFWRAKGWLHLNRNEIPKARDALDRALKIFPIGWSGRSWLADVARREGNPVEAARLDELVRRANRLRDALTKSDSDDQIPRKLFAQLAGYARDCGDLPFSDALNNRLEQLKH
jgi:tetratricopeptide (TPR) repeat protein